MANSPTPVPGIATVAVIANPKAGSTSSGLLSEVEALCASHGARANVLLTRYHNHAIELARQCGDASDNTTSRPDAIVSIGGDGTFRQVVTGLLDLDNANVPPLLVLPGGTANSNFRSLWDDVPWQEALTATLTGVEAETRALDLALLKPPDSEASRQARTASRPAVSGRFQHATVVVLGTSTGLFGEATARARSLRTSGRARYQEAISSVLASFTPYAGRVTADGVVVHEGKTVLVNVGGSRYRAGVFNILPHSIRDDGLLDVCVIGPETPTTSVLDLMRTGDHLTVDGVWYGRGRSITIERLDGDALCYEHDGEVVPSDVASLTIEVLPQAVRVFMSSRRSAG